MISILMQRAIKFSQNRCAQHCSKEMQENLLLLKSEFVLKHGADEP
jgi:hypothetical protein